MLEPVQALGLLVAGLLGLFLVRRLKNDGAGAGFLKTQPVLGVRDETFPWTRALARSLVQTSDWVAGGFEKYGRANMPFTIPSLDHGPVVVIPPQQIKRIYGQPESVLEVRQVQDDTMQLRWTFPDAHLHKERLHIGVVKNQLTQSIPRLTPLVAAELDAAFERCWGGGGGDWAEVRAWRSSLGILASAANGAFCGRPLCRDAVFLDALRDHVMTLFSVAMAISCLPALLHPVVGPFATVVCGFMAERAKRRSRPVVLERLEKTARLKADAGYEWTPPQDGLQWMIQECYASPNPANLEPERVLDRLLISNNISLLTTGFTAQNLILDIYSSDPALDLVEALREECTRALAEAGGVWTHEAVKKLQLVDATIRESMRMSPFGSLALPRRVAHPDGLRVDGWSVPVPRGTHVGLPIEAIQYDAQRYADAHTFNPHRFVEADGSGSIRAKSAVTLDDGFLSFGVPGRNACPGRFFALMELKLFVAHMVLYYDVERLAARARPRRIMWANYPADAKIRVRRKAHARGS